MSDTSIRWSLIVARTFSLVGLLALGANAGKYNTVLDIGDKAPLWSQLPATDGKQYSLGDFDDDRVVVVAFTCNSCPYAVDHEQRLIQLAKKYDEKHVGVVAINVNRIDEDRMSAMKRRRAEAGFNFPYLFDESQRTAKEYGAAYTPEFFVLGPKRTVVYMGSMDDSPDGSKIGEKYLEQAVQASLRGEEPTTTETVPIGCRIRFERSLRSK